MTSHTTIDLGIWLPIFGGWLRNIDDEGMEPTFEYNKKVAQAADRLGFSTALIAELNLNDIKGPDQPCLECWSTAAALAPLTEHIRLMAAIRPGYREPAIVAKMAANIDQISNGRFELNLVSGWWKEEMEMYVGEWLDHANRYERSAEFAQILRGTWTEQVFSFDGEFYQAKGTKLEPKPVQPDGCPIYAGGGSENGRNMIAKYCDHYLMHGSSVDDIAGYIADMRERRDEAGFNPDDMQFGMAAFMICRDSQAEAQEERERITSIQEGSAAYHSYKDFVSESQSDVSVEDYAVSNKGLVPDLVGTPAYIEERLQAYADVGLDLVLLQASPMLEEIERIGEEVIPRLSSRPVTAS